MERPASSGAERKSFHTDKPHWNVGRPSWNLELMTSVEHRSHSLPAQARSIWNYERWTTLAVQ
jgi:hypothetical protein